MRSAKLFLITSFFLGSLMFHLPLAFVAKLAPSFPSSASLQPIPESARPSVSETVNHSAKTANSQINNSSETKTPPSVNKEEEKIKSVPNLLLWIFIFAVIIVSVSAAIFKKHRKHD